MNVFRNMLLVLGLVLSQTAQAVGWQFKWNSPGIMSLFGRVPSDEHWLVLDKASHDCHSGAESRDFLTCDDDVTAVKIKSGVVAPDGKQVFFVLPSRFYFYCDTHRRYYNVCANHYVKPGQIHALPEAAFFSALELIAALKKWMNDNYAATYINRRSDFVEKIEISSLLDIPSFDVSFASEIQMNFCGDKLCGISKNDSPESSGSRRVVSSHAAEAAVRGGHSWSVGKEAASHTSRILQRSLRVPRPPQEAPQSMLDLSGRTDSESSSDEE